MTETKEEIYKIVKITDFEGNIRLDGKYPTYIGRVCEKPNPICGQYMHITFEDKSQYDGITNIRTSVVTAYSNTKSRTMVKTLNSIYTFELEK